jgi:hypothetical protein
MNRQHLRQKWVSSRPEGIPDGFCYCGCGEPTKKIPGGPLIGLYTKYAFPECRPDLVPQFRVKTWQEHREAGRARRQERLLDKNRSND